MYTNWAWGGVPIVAIVFDRVQSSNVQSDVELAPTYVRTTLLGEARRYAGRVQHIRECAFIG